MTEVETIKQEVQFIPQKLEFYVMKDSELGKLVVDHSEDIKMEQISLLCGWFEDNKTTEICLDCLKDSKPIMKFAEERHFITYLVQQNVLPEGNYMIIIT